MNELLIDFVTVRPDGGYCLRLREEGPWVDAPQEALKRIQGRLYDAIEIVADGKFAQRYPESRGKLVSIKLDCFRVPKEDIDSFFARFVAAIRASDEWAPACALISFELNHLDAEKA